MNSKFFTNENNNNLKNKINHILLNDKNIEYLDFIIGYFRITGFNKISDNISQIKHIRLLIGINADKETYHASQLIEEFIDNEELNEDIYINILSMKDFIETKRISIRIAPNKDIH